MTVTKTEGTFPSSNGSSTVHYTVWKPDCNPAAMIQISHGMREYIDRYDEVARYLCEQGYIVFGNDHIGHGRSVDSAEEFGYFAESDGDLYLVRDLYALNQIMKKTYRSLPVVLLGHSFGSYIARAYLMGHADSVDGLILSGTSAGTQPLWFGKAMSSLIGKLRGKQHRSKFINRLAFGGYNKRCKAQSPQGKRTGYEWVTSDPDELTACAADPRCTFIFTVGGFYDLFTLLSFVNSAEWYQKFPKGLPTLLMSGEEDPVGGYGKDVPQIAEALLDADSSDIEYKLYPNERHEPLTGVCKAEAMRDVADFVAKVVEGVQEARKASYWSPVH